MGKIFKKANFEAEGIIVSDLKEKLQKGELETYLLEKAKKGTSNYQKYGLMIKNALLGEEYSGMYEEMQKFEFEEGSEKEKFQMFVSKKREHGCAGLNMGVCVAPDEQLWNNPNFMNVIIKNENLYYGGMHFLVAEEEGSKYLTLPGINPNEALLSTVAAEDLYDKMIDYAKKCAKAMGCKKVLIPTASVIHSNRSSIQDVIRKKNYTTFNFKNVIAFSYSPYAYNFQDCYEVS